MQYRVEFTAEFLEWLRGLKDRRGQEAVTRRLVGVRNGNFGDRASVGDGVSELRIHIGPGYRAYYTMRDRTVVFMLVGGAKRTQDRDIDRAKILASRI